MRIVRASSIRDWIKFPEFVHVLEKELEDVYRTSGEIFVSGNPHMTHEAKAKLIGREHLLHELLAMFKDGDIRIFFNERNGVELLDGEESGE